MESVLPIFSGLCSEGGRQFLYELEVANNMACSDVAYILSVTQGPLLVEHIVHDIGCLMQYAEVL